MYLFKIVNIMYIYDNDGILPEGKIMKVHFLSKVQASLAINIKTRKTVGIAKVLNKEYWI